MQQLTAPPTMSSPTPSMASSVPYSPPPAPRVGPAIPGTTGGLPAPSGLSVYQNPMAQQLQSMGRGDDKMLVHMTPREVQSLRGLAQLTGGDLTTNPNTGLPEAGWLGNLLPTLLGGLASLIPGVAPWMIGLAGTVGGTAATGNLGKGLMMGLGAFGGASLGNALGAGKVFAGGASNAAPAATAGSGASAVAPAATAPITTTAAGVPTSFASELAGAGAPGIAASASQGVAGLASPVTTSLGSTMPALNIAASPSLNLSGSAIADALSAANPAITAANTLPSGIIGKFGQAASKGLGTGMLAKAAPYAAGLGLIGNTMEAFKPGPAKDEEDETYYPFGGPYRVAREEFTPAPIDLRGPNPSAQRRYTGEAKYYDRFGNEFIPGTPSAKPMPYYPSSAIEYAAKGGEIKSKKKLKMKEGSFIFPARETAELGNGSSRAGQEVLARMGGRPIDGKGDGVSDSIPARIGNRQEARVARDEVYFSPQAVARIGGGDHNRGTKKLYALMDKAKKARMRAAVGGDTGLRRGIV